MENSKKLMEIELGQTFENYSAAAAFTAKLMKEARLENCEIIDFPADGKTVYQDKCMPIAWRASVGKLTIKKSSVPFDDPVVADYKRHPFHLVKGSVATPPGGLNVRIITESQLFAGEDAKGCLIMLNPFTWPRAKILTPALDLGAIGLVSDFLTVRNDTPHAVQWVTACTEGETGTSRPTIARSYVSASALKLERECERLQALEQSPRMSIAMEKDMNPACQS